MRLAFFFSLALIGQAVHLPAQWQQLLGDPISIWALHTKGDTVLVGTQDGRVFFSNDLGLSWEDRTGNLATGIVDNIAVAANNRLACTVGSHVWISDDWMTWTDAYGMGSSAICMIARDSVILAGAELSGGLHASFDNGASWDQIGSGYSTSVGLRSDTIIWTRFSADPLRTADWGDNWEIIPGLTGDLYFSVSENGRFAGDDNNLYRSVGPFWLSYTTNWQVLDFAIDGTFVAADGEGDEVLLSDDQGVNWHHILITPATGRVELSGGFLFAGGQGLYRLHVDTFLGIQEGQEANNDAVYPNPASSSITVSWNGSSAPDRIEIVDACGRQVRSLGPAASNASSAEMEVEDLEPGSYLVRISTRTMTRTVSFVVMR